MDTQAGIMVERPYGGISILWNKSISSFCNVQQYDDDRLLGISVSFGGLSYLFLNVYLPYFCSDNINEYDMYMGKIASIIDNSGAAGVVVIGDFNASPNNSFYTELQQLCTLKDLIISDIAKLPRDTFTHVNSGSLSRSWLDHCVTSQSVHDVITNIFVDENFCGSDHFPMHVSFNFGDLLKARVVKSKEEEKIKWNFSETILSTIFYSVL